MKELDQHKPAPNDGKMAVVKPYQTQVALGQFKLLPGHTAWEGNLVTGEVKPASYEEVNIEYKGGIRNKIITKPDCIYVSALNEKNAHKQFIKKTIKLLKVDR